MAQVKDSIAATVTLKADGAIRDLGTLSRKAKETGQTFNDVGRNTTAAGAKINSGAATGARGLDGLSKSGAKASGVMGSLKSGSVGLAATSSTLVAYGAAATGAVAGLSSVINAQSRLADVTNSSKVTFGEASAQVEKFAASATTIGLSKRAAIEASVGFGALLTSIGYTQQASAGFATSLTGLSADLASTFGGSVEDASAALRALFRGEGDPIEKYNIKINEAAVTQRAMQLGLAATAGQLSEQDKTLARLTLAYTQSTKAQGDFNRTQADTANQQRILSAQWENLKASGGGVITPVWTQTLQGFNSVLGDADTQAQKYGTSMGDVLKTIHKYTNVVGFLGSQQKDSATNFKDSEDALKTFSQELNGGRANSQAYAAAVAYLKKANKDAEASSKALGDAIGDAGTKAAQARQEMSAEVSTVQSLAGAQRSAEDATIRVTDSRRNLADAERSLGEIRSKGKVDAEKVVDAEWRMRDASIATVDARRRLGDAERSLRELRAKGAVDADKVVDAERSIIDASRSLVAARRAVADAEKEVARLRAGPTGDEAVDAARAVTQAQLDLERAQLRQVEAMQAVNESRGSDTLGATLDLRAADLSLAEAADTLREAQEAQVALNARGVEGTQVLADAEDQLSEARHREEEAVRRQTEAQTALRKAQVGDPDFAHNLAAAVRDVEAARRGVESAERAENTASTELRKARAGDPEFERNLARANDEVTKARRDLERAEKDLPFATLTAKLAQEDFNAKVSAGTQAAWNLANMANDLGVQYNFVGSAAYRAAHAIGSVNAAASGSGRVGGGLSMSLGPLGISLGSGGLNIGFRAAGGPVTAGSPYVVGEKGPELYVPTSNGRIIPNGAASGSSPSVVHTHIYLDGRQIAESVTTHQAGKFLRGGQRP